MKEVLILSVPYCEPRPMAAPVLLAGCLEAAGISAKGIDFNAEFLKHFKDHPSRIEIKHFLTIGHLVRPTFDRKFFKEIIKFTKKFLINVRKTYNPKYIGLSIFTSESLDFGLLLSYLIRKHCPGVTIMAGGKGLEVAGPDGKKHFETWLENAVADVIVEGDAETAIVDIVKNNLVGFVQAKKQTKEDLDNVPLAKWEDYDLSIYQQITNQWVNSTENMEPYFSVTGSKGCVRQCTFCDVASFWPDFIYRDPVKVAEEIIHNYRSTGVKKFEFTDNLINGSVSNFRTMNQVLAEQIPNTIQYGGYAIFRGKSQQDEDDFKLASIAGNNYWCVGVESGSEKIRYDMKKKFTNDDLDWSVNMLHKYNIQQIWLLIVGYPSETEEDFHETKDLVKRYAKLAAGGAITIQVTPTFMVLNNSPLVTNPELSSQYGLSHIQKDAWSNKFWTSTKYLDNDYPTRSRRWKELIQLVQDSGYQFGAGMPVEKWHSEIQHLDKIYEENRVKIFPIHTTK